MQFPIHYNRGGAPVEVALLREAAKRQDDWQQKARVISTKDRDTLVTFVKSLIDNNKERYFYIHTDVQLGIQQNRCAFLQLAVSLEAEHYDMCLAAKICELEEMFQAKLGFHIGHMYNRVGTTEWNSKYPDYDVATAAKDLIDATFIVFEERQIKEGLSELRRDKALSTKTPEEIRDYIDMTKVVAWRDQFQEVALNVLTNKRKPVDLIRAQIETAVGDDAVLAAKIDALLTASGVPAEKVSETRDSLMRALKESLRLHLSDAKLPQKRDFRKDGRLADLRAAYQPIAARLTPRYIIPPF